jgi:hypothetical protein
LVGPALVALLVIVVVQLKLAARPLVPADHLDAVAPGWRPHAARAAAAAPVS